MKETKNLTATNWTQYYSRPKSVFSTLTQKITLKKLSEYMNRYAGSDLEVMELGGGNSCFAEKLMKRVDISEYSVIDNCAVAIEKFREMQLPGNAYLTDLTKGDITDEIQRQFDVVYSVGLIEHFRDRMIKKIIGAHFQLCKTGGLVVICVPTPTLQYRIVRKGMELAGKWGFPDEKPLKDEDLDDIINSYGSIVEKKINYRLPLTQLIYVVKTGK